MMRLLSLVFLLASAVHAAGETAPSELRVEGTVLIFDTETGVEDGEIDRDDTDRMRALLRDNAGVTLLSLNSGGGSVSAADAMARMVLDFGLDTQVDGRCTSSCVTVFLGGKARSMTRGSSIGFHSRSWSPENIQSYYEDNKAEEGWNTPFDFASWVYADTQAEVYQAIVDVIARGVDAGFAVRMHTPRDQMWYPERAELEAAGVLRP